MAKSKKSKKKKRDSSSDSSEEQYKKTLKKKKNKRKYESSSDSTSDSSDTESKKKERKEKKKLKALQKKLKKLEKKRKLSVEAESDVGPSLSSPTEEKKAMVPMTKEEYEKQQSEVRREFDPTTGRTRLVRGSGEIVEEIVTKSQQKEINKLATLGDGLYYQKQTGLL